MKKLQFHELEPQAQQAAIQTFRDTYGDLMDDIEDKDEDVIIDVIEILRIDYDRQGSPI